MAPIRRYLRITKYSALEVRIYLDKPSDTPWLLSSRDPALPRIIKLIRPKILPKLREENENSKKKGGKKKKNIRDVAAKDDFEVILFLTDTSTRHSIVTKQKRFTNAPPIMSTSTKMTGWLESSKGNAIDLSKDDDDDDDDDHVVPMIRREESDEDVDISVIPQAGDPLPVHSSDDETSAQQYPHGQTNRRSASGAAREVLGEDKKKMLVKTTYDSFSIYGKTLCLIVKRKSAKTTTAATIAAPPQSSQMMEQWVSTQADMQPDLADDDP